jgi:putative tryptophan/tyrosine transport system substrate-binding protein
MRRREFITLLGGAAAAGPLVARAQQPAMPVVGYVGSTSLDGYVSNQVAAFRHGLNEAGFVEGQNVTIDFLWAEGQYDRLPILVSEFVSRQVAVILAGALPAALAAKGRTSTIPIVFVVGADPVKLGVVASLNRPGGNVTGISQYYGALGAKRLELLREFVPSSSSAIAIISNPKNPNAEDHLNDVLAAARAVGQQTDVFHASSESQIDAAFADLVRRGDSALLVADDPFFSVCRNQIVALAGRRAVPTIYYASEFATAGGLISYGSSSSDNYRQAGIYVGRILKGAKPADLPVLQPAKFELVINLKTAKALGLDIPPTLLARADEVIE